MTFTREQLVKAFPDQPLLVAEFEALDVLLETAKAELAALNEAIAAAEAQIAAGFQPADPLLTAIAALDPLTGAIEITDVNTVAVRSIDGADPASLLSRSNAYAVLVGRAGKGATGARPALAAQQVAVYFDTTLAAAGKPVFWTGTDWVDATGAVV